MCQSSSNRFYASTIVCDSSYPPHFNRDCPQSPNCASIFDIRFRHQPQTRACSTYIFSFFFGSHSAFSSFVSLTMLDDATIEARRALEVHMHQVRGKPPDDRDVWGRQFVKLWVSTPLQSNKSITLHCPSATDRRDR